MTHIVHNLLELQQLVQHPPTDLVHLLVHTYKKEFQRDLLGFVESLTLLTAHVPSMTFVSLRSMGILGADIAVPISKISFLDRITPIYFKMYKANTIRLLSKQDQLGAYFSAHDVGNFGLCDDNEVVDFVRNKIYIQKTDMLWEYTLQVHRIMPADVLQMVGAFYRPNMAWFHNKPLIPVEG
jgi:hypothetical protein